MYRLYIIEGAMVLFERRQRWILCLFIFSLHNIRVTITIGGIKSGIWQLDVIRNAQKRYRLTSFVLLFIYASQRILFTIHA